MQKNRPACLLYPRVAILSLIIMVGSLMSQPAMAALCSGVFPKDSTEQSVAKLDLEIMDRKPGKDYKPFPTAGITLAPGDYFYVGDKLKTKAAIKLSTPGQQVRIFIEGDTEFAAHSEINMGGSAADLLIVVRGDLSIGTKNRINALIYVTGDTDLNPDVHVSGALTAEGSVSTKVKDAIDYDKVAAEKFSSGELCTPDGAAAVDHFELVIGENRRFSCDPIPVKIRACADSACSTTIAINHTLSMTPADRWLGGGTVTFAETDMATGYLARKSGKVLLGVLGEVPQCRSNTGSCELTILDSGFVLSIPEVIAGGTTSVGIRAMRFVDDPTQGACMADHSFADGPDRILKFWSYYDSPKSGEVPLRINNVPIGSSEAAATPISLSFGSQANSSFQVRYDDAGKMWLNVLYEGDGDEAELRMLGSEHFVSRPDGFCIQAYRTGCSDVGCRLLASNGEVLRAGETFDLHIKPVQKAVSPLQEHLCAAQPTANFTDELILHAPFDGPGLGREGTLEKVKYSHPIGGAFVLRDQKLHEVGNFKLEVRAEHYEGLAPFGSFSDGIGRFVPGYLKAELKEVPKLTPGCGNFSYQDQSISYRSAPELTVTGMSLGDRVTHNYDLDAFWKVPGELKTSLEFADGQKQEAARLDGTGVFKLPTGVSDISGDGSKTYRMEGGSVLYRRDLAGPQPEDEPFEPELILVVPGAEFKYEESAGVITCHDDLGCPDFKSASFGFENSGGEIRLGRVSVSSAHGVEFEPLELIYQTEIWRDGAFSSETSGCTAFTDVDLREFTGNLEGHTHAQVLSPVLGIGRIRLTAPGEGGAGSVTVIPRVSPELTFNWKGEGFEEPSGLATFGIYKGNDKIIFRREIIGR